MILINFIVGNIFQDPFLGDKFKKLSSEKCERIRISRIELEKNRFRRNTDKGTDVGISLESDEKLHNGDVLLDELDKFIVIEQMPEKVISINVRGDLNMVKKIMPVVGHIIGNRHRPIQIDEEGIIYFPVMAESEIETFSHLFGNLVNHMDINIQERIFEPEGSLNVHEH
ncbi:MAG: urease accessory protein UreE [Nitrosotalea sp.]